MLFKRLGQCIKPMVEIRDFIRGDQAEVSAREIAVLHLREISEHRQPAFAFEDRLQVGVKAFRAVIQQQRGDVIRRAEFHQSFDLSGEGDPDAGRIQNQDDRGIAQRGNMPRAAQIGRASCRERV